MLCKTMASIGKCVSAPGSNGSRSYFSSMLKFSFQKNGWQNRWKKCSLYSVDAYLASIFWTVLSEQVERWMWSTWNSCHTSVIFLLFWLRSWLFSLCVLCWHTPWKSYPFFANYFRADRWSSSQRTIGKENFKTSFSWHSPLRCYMIIGNCIEMIRLSGKAWY